MKLYLFHLDVASPNGFILHIDYYYYYYFFGESFADLFWSVTFLLVSNSINNSYYWNAYL